MVENILNILKTDASKSHLLSEEDLYNPSILLFYALVSLMLEFFHIWFHKKTEKQHRNAKTSGSFAAVIAGGKKIKH